MIDALEHGETTLNHFTLHSYVVMQNHVHILISPHEAPPKILHSLKGFTAREANKILDRTGNSFWEREYYDHWLREGEFDRIQRYIENNPVKAGLVAAPEDYPWSSAFPKAKASPCGAAGLFLNPQAGAASRRSDGFS